MTNSQRKSELFNLFRDITQKKTIVKPIKTNHGTLRDQNSIEKELSLIVREILEEDLLKTDLLIQISKIIIGYYAGKSDNQISRELGNEKLCRSVGRARIRLKMFRDFDFDNIPFKKEEMDKLLDLENLGKK